MRAGTRMRGPYRRRLVLMIRLAVAGQVKTRLAREIGAVRAAAFYRQTCAAVLARLADGRRWETLLAVSPDAAVGSRAWPAHIARLSQGRGDLGRRMQGVMDRLPPGPVLIVGTDIPGIRAADIAEAFRALGAHDAVLGPAADGGYWLVGLKRIPRVVRAFDAVRWSGPHALADTLGNLNGLRFALTRRLDDVDRAGDLARFAGLHGRRIVPLWRAR